MRATLRVNVPARDNYEALDKPSLLNARVGCTSRLLRAPSSEEQGPSAGADVGTTGGDRCSSRLQDCDCAYALVASDLKIGPMAALLSDRW
jgi:hypothetical protein